MEFSTPRFAVFLCLLLAGAFGAALPAAATPGEQLMATSAVRLLAEPRHDAEVLGMLHRGRRVVEVARSPARQYVFVVRQGEHDSGWVSAASLTDASGRATVVTDFKNLGYPDGYLVEGPETKQAHNFYFHIPQETEIDGGVLHIHYDASTILTHLSNLRVDVNGVPRVTRRLSGPDSGEQLITVPLGKNDLKGGLLKLTCWVTLLVEEDRCLDGRVNTGYLEIKPDSALSLDVKLPAGSVRGFWDLLPDTVRVSLPGRPLRPEEFAAAWRMSELLIRQGKKVDFVTLPRLGEVVVAPAKEIRAVLEDLYRVEPGRRGMAPLAAPFRMPDDVSQIGLVQSVGGNFLALTEPYNNEPFYLLDYKWRKLAAGREYRGVTFTGEKRKSQERYEFRFSDLGMDTAPRSINTEVGWRLELSSMSSLFPPDYIPELLKLQVIASPSQTENPMILSVYLNNVLQKVMQIEDNGKPQSFIVSLAPEHVRFYNEIRFTALRSDPMGNCKGVQTRYPIQILPESVLVMKRLRKKPERFNELRPYFAEGFELLLPRSALKDAGHMLAVLSQLSADMSLDAEYGKLRFFAPDEKIRPGAPFLLLGRAPSEFDRVPVRLDRGRVLVQDNNNRVLLNTAELPEINVAQIVRSGSFDGLWLAAAHGDGVPTTVEALGLSENDVAFIDPAGVRLTFDSRRDVFLKSYYPEYQSWFDQLGRYHYWWVSLSWIVFVLAGIYLVRKNLRSRKARREEKKAE